MFQRIRRDISAVMERDPAATSRLMVFFCSPGLHAIWGHRQAHWLHCHGMKGFARFWAHINRFFTGVEIHPGAQIGRRVFIDHGMGIVIGETTVIGENVTLYKGVVLGGTGKDRGKRHPTLGNNVLVGNGARILGPFKVGDNARIAAGSVVLREVPPDSTAVGVPAQIVRVHGESVHYADEVDQIDVHDPMGEKLEALSSRLELLEKLLDKQYYVGYPSPEPELPADEEPHESER